MAVPSFIATSTAAETSSNQAIGPRPAGTQTGDLLLAAIVSNGGTITAVPAGWTLLREVAMGSNPAWQRIYYKYAGSSEPASYSWTSSYSGYHIATVVTYRGVTGLSAGAGGNGTSSASVVAPSMTSGSARLVGFFAGGDFSVSSKTFTPPASMTERADYGGSHLLGSAIADESFAGSGSTGSRTATASISLTHWGAALVALVANTAPNAPTLTTPANNATIDRSITQRFAWTFSDPDAGDSQSKFDLQYRLVGGSTWTTVTQTIPNAYYDFASGTFAAGNYEWQVRTYDAQGVVGPWSASSFFTAADAPAMPTITVPTSGGTVGNTQTVTWSAPNQTDYQIRRVADNAGSPNTGTVYYDSGDVVSSTARSQTLTFETNNRYEHIQVRIKNNGLWSAWASIRVQVSYTPPTVPVVSLLADDDAGSLVVTVTNPAPGAGVPATSYNDLYVDDGSGEERKATMVTPNTSWTYWTPVALRDYAGHVRVVAVATNGTTTSS